MVTPDYTAFDQDRARGLVRDLHESIAQKPRIIRNQPGADYDAMFKLPRILSTQCEDGYLLGIPYGRHLKLFYEFDTLGPLRAHLRDLVSDMGELALKHSDCRLMALEFDDFPNRHHIEHTLVGSRFRDPLAFLRMRCRDMREQELPEAPRGVTVRAATKADAEAIGALEERTSGADALAPPLPDGFFAAARTILVAERAGVVTGYIRLLDDDRRALMAEEFLVDEEGGSEAATALLRATMEHGRGEDRRALSIRVAADAAGDPIFASFGFKHDGDGLQYLRPADPVEAEATIEESKIAFIKVGKIFGRF